MKKKLGSSALCLLTALIWGFAFSAQDIASKSSDLIDSFSFNAIRFFVGGLSLLPVVLLYENRKEKSSEKAKNTIIYGVITGLVLFAASALQQFGIQMTGESGKAGFITSLYIVFVPVITFLIFKQKPSPLVWFGMCFAFIGLYFLCLGEESFFVQKGDLLVLTSSLMYTCQIILIDRNVSKVSTIRFSMISYFVVAVCSIVAGMLFGHISFEGIKVTIFPILYCGVMSTGVAYTLQTIGQKNTPPAIAAILFSTESVFSVIAESLVEKRLPSQSMLIGCALMFVGIILSQFSFSVFRRKEKKNEQEN